MLPLSFAFSICCWWVLSCLPPPVGSLPFFLPPCVFALRTIPILPLVSLSLFLGTLTDLTTGSPIGAHLLPLVLTLLGIYPVQRLFFQDHLLSSILLYFMCLSTYQALLSLIFYILGIAIELPTWHVIGTTIVVHLGYFTSHVVLVRGSRYALVNRTKRNPVSV